MNKCFIIFPRWTILGSLKNFVSAIVAILLWKKNWTISDGRLGKLLVKAYYFSYFENKLYQTTRNIINLIRISIKPKNSNEHIRDFKNNSKTEPLRREMQALLAQDLERPGLMQFFVSKQWLNKFDNFAEPGKVKSGSHMWTVVSYRTIELIHSFIFLENFGKRQENIFSYGLYVFTITILKIISRYSRLIVDYLMAISWL